MKLLPCAVWTPGLPELIVILVIILLLFGYKRLPELMRNLGSGVKEFKRGVRDGDHSEGVDDSRDADKEKKNP